MSLTATPAANRLHIAVFGQRNAGKSSLLNALTGQDTALVSAHAGTTTDPVFKAMELSPIGPVLFIDTAGFDDKGELGALRVQRTESVISKADLALLLFTRAGFAEECAWARRLLECSVRVVAVVNKADLGGAEALAYDVYEALGLTAAVVSARAQTGLEELRAAIVRAMPESFEAESITGALCGAGDVVLLVMPQDTQAPKGRLILPQVQVTRELLDKKCIIVSTPADGLSGALAALKAPPALIITDSQCFAPVYAACPPGTPLTSFSVLFAGYKGDISAFTEGAHAISALTQQSRVLIAEACTHAPLSEDIGRVKLPRLLRQRIGEGLTVDITAGTDFPADLSPYALVIHCGACMFNRKYVLSRIAQARAQGVPITNYGVALAYLTGILEHIAGVPHMQS